MAAVRVLPISTLMLTALLIAGCGNSTPAQPSSAGGPRTSAAPVASVATTGATSATTAPAGSTGSAPQPAASAATGTSGRFCVNTNEEVSAAFGVQVARAENTENPGFGGGCIYYDAAGNLVYSIGFVPVVQGVDMIATGLQTPGAVKIDGIGEAAVLVSPAGPLAYKQGNWTVSTGGAPPDPNAADTGPYRAALETLAKAGVARINF
jgi:hypothetical protein